MRAEELRLKNFVFIDNGLLPETKGKTHIVTGIQNRSDKDFPDLDAVISLIPYERSWRNYSQWNEYIKPIPLTEEWLLKFKHSEKTQIEGEIKVYSDFLFIWKSGYNYWYVVTRESHDYLTKIEFVHEYQNFIFALRGNELEIK